MLKPDQDLSIESLLLTTATTLLVSELQIPGALAHVRAFGPRFRQKVLSISLSDRSGASFVCVRLQNKAGEARSFVLLVEEDWNILTQEKGASMSGTTYDARIALAEIEARLRVNPELANLGPNMAAGSSAGKGVETSTMPAPPVTPAREGESLHHDASAANGDHASSQGVVPIAEVQSGGATEVAGNDVETENVNAQEVQDYYAPGAVRQIFEEQAPVVRAEGLGA